MTLTQLWNHTREELHDQSLELVTTLELLVKGDMLVQDGVFYRPSKDFAVKQTNRTMQILLEVYYQYGTCLIPLLFTVATQELNKL